MTFDDEMKDFMAGARQSSESVIDPKTLYRFGHHPDPIVDWEVEVECLHSGMLDRELGLEEYAGDGYGWQELLDRIVPAIQFGANLPRDEGNVAANYLKLVHIENWLNDNRWRRPVTPMQKDTLNRFYRAEGGVPIQIIEVIGTGDEQVLKVLESKRSIQREQIVAMEEGRKIVILPNEKGVTERFKEWFRAANDRTILLILTSVFFSALSVACTIGAMVTR